jgi:hypothetical protein
MNDYFDQGMSMEEKRSRQKRCFLVKKEIFFNFNLEVVRARVTGSRNPEPSAAKKNLRM